MCFSWHIPENQNKYLKYIQIPVKPVLFPKSDPKNQKTPKIYSEYQKYIFKILKFYPKPETVTENSNLKLKRISVIPKTYPKYLNMPNIHKTFMYFGYPARFWVGSVWTEIYRSKNPQYVHFPRPGSDWVYFWIRVKV